MLELRIDKNFCEGLGVVQVGVYHEEVLESEADKLIDHLSVDRGEGGGGDGDGAGEAGQALGLANFNAGGDDAVDLLGNQFGNLLRNEDIAAQREMTSIDLTGARRDDDCLCSFAALRELRPAHVSQIVYHSKISFLFHAFCVSDQDIKQILRQANIFSAILSKCPF